ncbi:hypothetical protein VYU27_001867 [Nannochloropsis oceanica]
MARDKRRRPGYDCYNGHAPQIDASLPVAPPLSSYCLPKRRSLLLLLLIVVGIVGRQVTASTPAAAFLLGPRQHAWASKRHTLSWRTYLPGPVTVRITSSRRVHAHRSSNEEEDETTALARRLFDQSEPPSPPMTSVLSSKKQMTTMRGKGRVASATRRDQLVTGGLLAGTLAATLLNLPPKNSVAQAAMSTPLYVDKEVWAPLENYMQNDGRDRQTTYSPKFTAYLARLLINYDYASMSWWQRKTFLAPRESSQRISRLLSTKGFEGTFKELDVDEDNFISQDELRAALSDPEELVKRERELLAQLQASVNFGLARYQGKEGVDRLCRILRSEFGINRLGKRQLANLFALMDNLQPVEVIKQLIAEAENASIVGFNVTYPGFGYDAEKPPTVTVSASPGANATVKARVKLSPTGRILKVVLDSPMTGFSSPPKLEVSPPIAEGGVRAVCIPKMNGDTLERVVLSNPGEGYSEMDRVSIIVNVEGQPLPWVLRQARPLLEMKVAEVTLLDKVKGGGEGYAHDLPIKVEISKPPFPVSAVATAKATAILSEPNELILRSWLPPTNITIPVTGLLPNNLVPKYDPCLERFIISPVEELDPNYCIYFEDEFKIVPSQKFSKYFSFLDGPKARDPVERERELDATVFWRFALCGALCCSTAHAVLVPLDVVKTKMQASPSKYPSFLSATRRIVDEGGLSALLLGAGPTVLGYLVYGAVSFGLTEYFKRIFLDLAGPEYATFYPFAILLLASMSAAFFGAVAVTPFEALRIRSVTSSENGGGEDEAAEEAAGRLESDQSMTSLEDSTRVREELEPDAPPPPPTAMEVVASEAEEEAPPQNLEGLVSVLAGAAINGVGNIFENLENKDDDKKSCESSSSGSSNSGSSSSTDSSSSSASKGSISSGSGSAATAVLEPPMGMVATVEQMLKEGTLGELYAGLGPAVVGEIPFMMTKFAVFDAVSKAIYAIYPSASESVALSLTVSLLSGMTAGVAAAAISQPLDTLTTKVTQYSQMKRGGGIVAAIKDIYGKGGVKGFFKGTFPRAVKSAANIALQFFLYDFSKRALHVSADDIKVFFDVISGLETGK